METDQQKQESKSKRRASAFLAVFGAPSRRSTDQKIVLEHLHECGAYDKPIFTVDKEGRFDPLRAAHLDGARTISLIVDRQVELARKHLLESKPKVSVKK